MTFRWYGKDDLVTLDKIQQIPSMSGIVSAVYDVPVGDVWSNESISAIKNLALKNNLEFKVVESVPVHEDIKLGLPTRDKYIDSYCENIRRLAKAGVEVICYNFMPVFDWLRSDLYKVLEDGSTALSFDNEKILAMDSKKSELSLPGWDESYTKEGRDKLLDLYKDIDDEKLWDNFSYFINKIIPVCEQNDIKMAIHPDDPPWGIFGLPRIFVDINSYERMANINPSIANGITLCLGSLGANPNNNIDVIAKKFGDRIHFVHGRNVKWTGERSFEEAPHPSSCGSLDMYKILKALYDAGFKGYMRPDHGRMIWGETGRPGYGLYDRALGATYLTGLWEAIEKNNQ